MFQSTTYEPYLYSGIFKGHKIFFLQQLDDFAIAAPTDLIVNKLFAPIQEKLKEPLKVLIQLHLYNGLDIAHGKHFIKLYC